MAHSKGHNRPTRARRAGKRSPKTRQIARIEAEIASLGLEGDGMALVAGKPAHVPFVLPGEQVALQVMGSRGRVLQRLKESPNRQAPLCAHFGDEGQRCGGCALQHVQQAYYRAWKQGVVRQALAREGFGDVEVRDLISSPLKARRRAGFTVQKNAGDILVGFQEKNAHTLVALEECHVLHPDLFLAREIIPPLVAPLLAQNQNLRLTAHVTLCEGGVDVDVSGPIDEAAFDLPQREHLLAFAQEANIVRLTINEVPFYAGGQVVVALDGVRVALPPRAFLQASEAGQETLQQLVKDAAAGAARVADLFAGCGTFTFALAKQAQVHAVESVSAAMMAVEQAKTAPGLKPISTETRDLFRQPLMPPELNKYDAVIFDPPRAGAEAQAEQLAACDVSLVVGVSCNPKTFARDARLLCAGGYELSHVQPVDQFLFSPHIELIGIFRR